MGVGVGGCVWCGLLCVRNRNEWQRANERRGEVRDRGTEGGERERARERGSEGAKERARWEGRVGGREEWGGKGGGGALSSSFTQDLPQGG